METYYAITGQTLADICMNTYGTMDYFYKLIQDSNIPNGDAIPYTGQPFYWDKTLVVDNLINITTTLGSIKYATAISGITGTGTYYVIVNGATIRFN
jgi:hypothetical protein